MSGALHITVLGVGHLSITHAASLASLGFGVLGVDTDHGRVDQLNAGHLPIYKPCLEQILGAGLDTGRLKFTTSYREAAVFGDVHFICTGTPQQPGSDQADLSQSFLRAGLGFGGGCLPKDIRAFVARAEELGAGATVGFLREVDAISLRCRARTADLALELAGGNLAGVPVCALGAAFKPGSDDVRDSPALDVAQILASMGAQVTIYDPAALVSARGTRPELGYARSLTEAARGAHIVLLLTEWPEFVKLSPLRLGGIVARRNIIDARNALDPGLWREAGWVYRALGVADEVEATVRDSSRG